LKRERIWMNLTELKLNCHTEQLDISITLKKYILFHTNHKQILDIYNNLIPC